jgi:hypothetical protein
MTSMDSNIISALITSIIGGLIVALVNFYLQNRNDRIIKKREAALTHLQRQIEELYAPLFMLIRSSHYVNVEVRDNILKISPEVREFDLDKLTPEQLEAWHYYVDNYFFPSNEKIQDLITSKYYLLVGGHPPKSFDQFLQHTIHFRLLHTLWKAKKIEIKDTHGVDWPAAFEEDVEKTLKLLRKRYDSFQKEVGGEFALIAHNEGDA